MATSPSQEKCSHCTHTKAEHNSKEGWCRAHYKPFAEKRTIQEIEQCLCTHFFKKDSPNP